MVARGVEKKAVRPGRTVLLHGGCAVAALMFSFFLLGSFLGRLLLRFCVARDFFPFAGG